MKKGSSDSPTNIFITIFVLLIILTILIYFSAQKLKSAASNKEMFANESSITFSPYLGSESYEKTTKQHMSLQDLQKMDSDQLKTRLASWERPYNGKTEGYINMEPCGIDGFHVYEFDETAPEYIILDPDNSRVKVNLNGCILDENGEETGEILFDPIKIEEMVELMEFNWNGLLEEAIKKWVKETLEKDFPQQSHLEFVYSF